MSVNIDMENFSATKNLRRRTFNTIKSAVTALKQITSKCSIVLEVFFYLNFLGRLRHILIYFLITRSWTSPKTFSKVRRHNVRRLLIYLAIEQGISVSTGAYSMEVILILLIQFFIFKHLYWNLQQFPYLYSIKISVPYLCNKIVWILNIKEGIYIL